MSISSPLVLLLWKIVKLVVKFVITKKEVQNETSKDVAKDGPQGV